MNQPIRILGIDPGTRHVGYGVVERSGNALIRITSGCIVAGSGPVAERLVAIHKGLADIMIRYTPATAAVETVFTGVNPKTAIAIGEGRGVAVLSVAECGVSVTGYEPALVKRAVAGSGRANKDQVRNMVRVLLALDAPTDTDHESDALALAITHARHMDFGPTASRKPGARARRCLPDAVLRQLPAGVASRLGR